MAVLQASGKLPESSHPIRGWDFDHGRDLDGIMAAMLHSGLQASALGEAVVEVNRMLHGQHSDEPCSAEPDPAHAEPAASRCAHTKLFLGYTSNLVSSGVREQIRWLVQHRMVDVLCTTAGGIEEDFIKCLAPTFTGQFHLRGAELRKSGLNRIGNMLVPNSNYCKFEDWVMPILEAMLQEQQQQGTLWTPSKVIHRLGKEINHSDSIYSWAYKHQIPVYCPGLTDGSLGDMLYFHSYKSPGLVIDIVADIRAINDEAMKAPGKTGILMLGGGLPKHHICNANLMRNGADYAVFLNTAQEFDGSDSGARPDEAVSWGKIKADARPVKVCGDASILFPLLISQTFAKLKTVQHVADGNASERTTYEQVHE
eukprot:jgi/Astpho2/2563/Aster-04272